MPYIPASIDGDAFCQAAGRALSAAVADMLASVGETLPPATNPPPAYDDDDLRRAARQLVDEAAEDFAKRTGLVRDAAELRNFKNLVKLRRAADESIAVQKDAARRKATLLPAASDDDADDEDDAR